METLERRDRSSRDVRMLLVVSGCGNRWDSPEVSASPSLLQNSIPDCPRWRGCSRDPQASASSWVGLAWGAGGPTPAKSQSSLHPWHEMGAQSIPVSGGDARTQRPGMGPGGLADGRSQVRRWLARSGRVLLGAHTQALSIQNTLWGLTPGTRCVWPLSRER